VHRLALVTTTTSGNERFFLGTDSAPHAQHAKESSCGCAGCYTALHAMELYATAFEQAGALDKLEAFASLNGPNFYGLPVNEGSITLKRETWTIPPTVAMGEEALVPLDAGGQIGWKML
jgi:dihydroorotase